MTHYRIVSDRSKLSSEAKSSVHPIHAHSRGVSGWVDAEVKDGVLDTAQPASARIEMSTESLRADNPLVNREIQKRLDARRYPTVVAEIQQVTEGAGDRYQVSGQLTLRQTTGPVTGWAVLVSDNDDTLEVSGEITLDVRDFQLEPPKLLGMKVHPEVTVTIQISATTER
jgi:polyisoprenoid-binding protein YceI